MIEVNLREASSGNVFANLNMEEPTLYLAKAQLANQICEIVREQNLSQARNASALPVVRDLKSRQPPPRRRSARTCCDDDLSDSSVLLRY